MCDTCGCGQPGNKFSIRKPGEENTGHDHEHNHKYEHTHDHVHDGKTHTHEHTHEYSHSHDHTGHDHTHDHSHEHHDHTHDHDHSHGTRISVEQDVLHKNDLLAERNRGFFEAKNIFTVNLVSSPGSGKTTLLEKTILNIGKDLDFYIIEGDQQTMNDADRIKAAGAPVIQVNTGSGCHLDAEMISKAAKELNISDNSVLLIENVGNLICPSMFDLGEAKRVVIISVTEGEDKPLKYPYMFNSSDICIINKTDLLPYMDFDIEKLKEYALRINHHLEIIELSAKTGEGMDSWYNWIKEQTAK